MKLSKLLREAGYDLRIDAALADLQITGVCFDTRTVRNGNLFIALRGQNTDSHFMLGDAAKRGAACAVTEEGNAFDTGGSSIPCLALPNTREALARLSDSFYGHPANRLTLVGVTGTNGKTTVSYLTSAILERAGMRVGMIGTVEGRSAGRVFDAENGNPDAHMTTPDPPVFYRMLSEMCNDACGAAVVEATSHASALHKLDPIVFDLLIFTNLTHDHLDFHRTPEAYFEAKARLFQKTKRALVNLDGSAVFGDPNGYAGRIERIARESGAEVMTCSADPEKDPDFLLCNLAESLGGSNEGISFLLKAKHRELTLEIRSPLLGTHNAMNLLESAAAALMLGVSPETVATALSDFSGVPGRMERVPLGKKADISVFIDFAHTPDALENLLRAVHGFRKGNGRITVLFGCGGDRDRLKRTEMAHIASRMADLIYITSDNSRSEDPNAIIKDILKGIDKEKACRVFPDRREAIENAVLGARAGDILLLCGKGHERYSIDRNGMYAFCESDIVKTAFEKRRIRQKNDSDSAVKE